MNGVRNFGEEADDKVWAAQAEFCLATGVQPSEYLDMTERQIEIWIAIHNKNTKQQNKQK